MSESRYRLPPDPPPGTLSAPSPPMNVSVVDFNIPFWRLVGLMVKVAFASIPAAIIVGIIYAIIWGLLAGFIYAVMPHPHV